MNNASDKKTVFRRINGRIVPISVRREAKAIAATGRDVKENPRRLAVPLFKAGAALVGGLGLAYGAGRLFKKAASISHPKKSEAVDRAAKMLDFTGKAGAGILAGSAFTSFDRATTKDEKSKLLNVGSQGTSALGLVAGLAGGYGYYRVQKRLSHWGKYGGKFPWKLKGR